MTYDVIIIGSGPAGLTAGIYTSRASLKTLCLSGSKWGGQLMQTTEVENFPGFSEGIQGPELMLNMRKQAERFGVEFIDKDVSEIVVENRPFTVLVENNKLEGKSIIIATGADTMWLNIPGEQKMIGRGVSSCAPCDAFFYKDKTVVVVGGGDSAMEEALVLTKFAKKVTVIHRKDSFKASKIMQDRVLNHEKIEVMWNTEVLEILGDHKVTGVKLKRSSDQKIKESNNDETIEQLNDEISEMPVDGVFVAIGHQPNSMIFRGKIELDEKGYVKKIRNSKFEIRNSENEVIGNKYPSLTSVEGVFAGGDIHDYTYRQAITAAGYGCSAGMDVERWLDEMDSQKPQEYKAVVTNKEQLSSKVYVFDLKLESPASIQFLSGQFINVRVGEDIHRPYSIASSPPGESVIQLLVDIAPGGLGSTYFSHLNVGDRILFNGPMGRFVLASETGTIVFLSAGTGLAPFKSMIDHLIENQQVKNDAHERSIYLYSSFRFEENIFWKEYFEQLEKTCPNFHYLLTLSQPDPEWNGCQGYVQACMDKQLLKGSPAHFYICGGNAMVQGVVNFLRTAEVNDDQIHFEPF